MKNKLEKYVRPNILKLKPYSSAREEYTGLARIYLDANENPYDTGYNRYPDPLQKDVKHQLSKLNNVAYESIFLGNGSDEVLDILVRIFCEPKQDAILFSSPTYGMYQVLADIHNIEAIDVPLLEDLSLDVEGILKQKAKVIFICSPNNPTGNQFKREQLLKILSEFDGLVVVDEAYVDFASYSMLPEISNYDNLVVCQTLSKSWGLAGLRLGMAYTNPALIELMTKVKMPYNVNAATQKEALKFLMYSDKTKENIQKILDEKFRMERAFSEMKFVKRIFPSDANFLMVEFIENTTKLHQTFLEKGVLVRNQSNKLHCKNTLRFTIGTKEENQEVLSILKEYFSS